MSRYEILSPEQINSVRAMKNGCILCGGTGSGKSRTAIGYYYILNGGSYGYLSGDTVYKRMVQPRDLYIITTAHKRDLREWESEFPNFFLNTDMYKNLKIVVDSWNNIKKYVSVSNSFFIFDEQRVIGNGSWVKSFYSISAKNEWVLLSATPGDCWLDYIPVFVANGFYKNRTDFINKHVIWKPRVKYQAVDRYWNESVLREFRRRILVDIDSQRLTKQNHIDILCDYDSVMYKGIIRSRWDPWTNKPIQNAAVLCYDLRKCVALSEDREQQFLSILEEHQKVIVFYNYDYELELLKNLAYIPGTVVREWNGHSHEQIPDSDRWVYLVQYTAGCEGWNCITTDTIIFYSQNYSYKVMEQAAGRIDRRNTPFKNLYYYHLKSRSHIDVAISRALATKKLFNASRYANKFNFKEDIPRVQKENPELATSSS